MVLNRRQFLASSGAAAGAFVLAQSATAGAALPKALSASDPRVVALRSSPLAELAARTFGAADWSGVRAGDGDALFVPLRAGSPTLLVLSSGGDGASSLRAAARRSGDAALFSGSHVVQLRERSVATLVWSTVDGRELATWQVEDEHRSFFGPAGAELARGLGAPPRGFASSVRPQDESGGLRRDATLLLRAGAQGEQGIRQAAAAA